MMNLFLALFWLICALMLLIYEQYTGDVKFRVHIRGISFSYVWPMLLLVLYNLQRWWRMHAARAKQSSLTKMRSDREWRRRFRDHEADRPLDPNLNFTDEPSPTGSRDITEQPKSPE